MSDDQNFFQKRYFARMNPSPQNESDTSPPPHEMSFESLMAMVRQKPQVNWALICGLIVVFFVTLSVLLAAMMIAFVSSISDINMSLPTRILSFVGFSVVSLSLLFYSIKFVMDFINDEVKRSLE